MMKLLFSISTCLLLLGSHQVQGQEADPAMMGIKAAEARMANQQALKNYSWKTRTELQMEGEVKLVRLELIRHDLDGNRQKTTLSEEKAEQKGRKRGVIAKVKKKKKAEFADWVQELGQLLTSYVQVSKGQMVDFFDQAKFSYQDGTVLIQGTNFIVPGDSVTYWLDGQSRQLAKMQIQTVHDEEQVELLVEFRQLEGGLNVDARSTVQVPRREIKITIENFDYERQ